MNRAEYVQKLREFWDVPTQLGDSGKVITDGEVAHFLILVAKAEVGTWCETTECETCDIFASVWWGWHNELPGLVRRQVQLALRESGIPLPPGPAEVTPRYVVPHSF